MRSVTLKWGTQRIKDVLIDTSASVVEFKHHVAELTGVEPDRQRLMTKGVLIGDHDSWESFCVQEGQVLMLVASQRRPVSATTAQAGSGCCNGVCYSSLAGLTTAGYRAAVMCLRALPHLPILLFSFFYTMLDPRAIKIPREGANRAHADIRQRPQQAETQQARRRVAVPVRCNDQPPLGRSRED
jgi:hypothetical protein